MDKQFRLKYTKEELDNLSIEEWDKIYLDYFMEQLCQSEEDFKNGRCMSLEELKKQLMEECPGLKF